MVFSYSGGNLASVHDAFNRTLTFTYSGTKISSLSDSSNCTVSYGYDANGNLTSYTDPAGKVWSYAYNSNSYLTVVTNPLNIVHVTNDYDSMGQVRTQTMPRQGGTNAIYNYYYSGFRNQEVDPAGNLLAETDGGNNITRYYIHGLGLLAMVTSTGQVFTYHYNPIGSTIAVTDLGQNVVNAYAYDSFGNILNQAENVAQPFKYVGQYGVMSEPNGFYYMRARYYDPQVGRFISEDPIGFDGGDVNLYGYVGNNSVNYNDPSGELFPAALIVPVAKLLFASTIIQAIAPFFLDVEKKPVGSPPGTLRPGLPGPQPIDPSSGQEGGERPPISGSPPKNYNPNAFRVPARCAGR